MAKKKRLKQLAAKTNGDDMVQIDLDQSELTTKSNNNENNTVSNSKSTVDIPEGNKTSESNKVIAGELAKSDNASTSLVSENVNSKSPVDKPTRPRSKPDLSNVFSDVRTPPKNSAAKQRRQKKDAVRSKIEQKMNMRMKKIKDPRLIPRMKEYLESRVNKNFVSIPLMADYLQQKYPEYGRKKKSMFVQYVDKAYSYMEKPCNNDPPPPLSDTDEDSNTEKELVEENGRYVWKNVSEHSREKDDDASEEKGEALNKDESSEDEDVSNTENLVEYKDTNSTNNRLRNMYRNSPTHVSSTNPDEKKRKLSEATPSNPKRSKSENKVLYPSPNVLERNMSSTGLVGPRRSSCDKYFIDRKGDDASKKNVSVSEFKDSREVTIQKFLGNLPSRTSFSSYVSGHKDPRLKGGTLYRVFTGKTEEQPELLHSGITEENVGTTDIAPRSPSSVVDEGDTPDETDPRLRNDDVDVRIGRSLPKSVSSNKDKPMKSKKKQTPKQKKSGSSSRNQDTSDPDTEEKGPALQKSTLTFADVGGNEKTLIEICKLLVHMRHPEVYCQLGVTPPRGFLLHGPPGCGKTLLANAIAGELDLPMMKLAATEIVSGVSGDSEEKIRGLFEKASQSAPCVVFIDEIDSITPKRETASKDMERRIVAQLLACMDDLNANPGCHVLVIGATNRPDSLDPALRRAGRFDREICLGIPDEPSRLKILEVLCRNLRLTSAFDFSYLAHNTPGYVGADLMALTREAAMTAVNRVFQSLELKPDEELTDKSMNSDLHGNSSEPNVNKQSSDVTLTTQGIPETNSSVELNKNSSQNLEPLSVLSSTSHVDMSSIANNTNATNDDCKSSSADNLLTWTTKPEHSTEDKTSDDKVMADNASGNKVMADNASDDKVITDSNVCKSSEINDSDDVTEDKISMIDKEKPVDSEHTETSDAKSEMTNNVVSMEVNADSALNNEVDSIEMKDTSSEGDRMEVNHVNEEIKNFSNKEIPSSQKTKPVPSEEYLSVLKWLKDHPPLSETQLKDLYITMEDFKEALTTVQPSAKREGFATVPDVTWEDIGALQDVREELQLAILAPVQHPEQFKSLGLNRAQGVLLAGPPGCGKTLLAKAVANESGINFISVKGPELLNMYVGESERAVRTVFQRARNSSPCVIFFDELDALCPRRSGSSEGNSSARVVNQLLTEMDGLEDRKQVFIMAATNRPDIIDPAVLRPGRLDKTLYVGLPTAPDRLDILNCLTKNGTKPLLGNDVDLTQIAEDVRCNCYTGADLAALVREASIAALKEVIMAKTESFSSPVSVTGNHFNKAFNKVKPSVSAKDQEKYASMRGKLEIV